jgi:hypothetical protein
MGGRREKLKCEDPEKKWFSRGKEFFMIGLWDLCVLCGECFWLRLCRAVLSGVKETESCHQGVKNAFTKR